MQCEKFERRLHQVLDRREAPEDDAQLHRHAQQCAACREMWLAQQVLLESLPRCELPIPEGFAASVVRAAMREAPTVEVNRSAPSLAKQPSRATAFPGSLRWVAWGAAAAILVALAPLVLQTGSSPEPAVITETSPSASNLSWESTPSEPSPEVGHDLARHQHPADSSTPNVVTSPAPGLEVTPEERYALMMEQLRMHLPELSNRLGLTDPTVQGAAAVSQLTDRLRTPLSASLESTLNVLRTAVLFSEQDPTKPQAYRLLPEMHAITV